VAPRPIAWVTTLADGVVNLAPFSWFQAVCADPPMVMIAFADRAGDLKDTARNILATGEFVINAVRSDLGQAMVGTSADLTADESEAHAGNIELCESTVVAPPRVAASPFHLECRLIEHHRYGDTDKTTMVIAEVVHIHAHDDVLDVRGNIDNEKVPLLARLGGIKYCITRDLVEIARPTEPDATALR
jgi:flavin reductase (DIM6/NTAB) family NADH-FMN oxidoreductase RutF